MIVQMGKDSGGIPSQDAAAAGGGGGGGGDGGGGGGGGGGRRRRRRNGEIMQLTVAWIDQNPASLIGSSPFAGKNASKRLSSGDVMMR